MNDTLAKSFRQNRESIGCSIESAARQTRIRSEYLEQMERGNFRFMPRVYVAGLARVYARWLGMSESDLDGHIPQIRRSHERTPSLGKPSRGGLSPAWLTGQRRWMIAAAISAAVLVTLWLTGAFASPTS